MRAGDPFVEKDLKTEPPCKTLNCGSLDCLKQSPRCRDGIFSGTFRGPVSLVTSAHDVKGDALSFSADAGIRETYSLMPRLYKRSSAILGKLLILFCIGAVITGTLIHYERVELAWDELLSTPWGVFFFVFGSVFLLVNVAILLWRIVLFFKYRPAPACPERALPRCTVIVPAYNEGEQVFLTLRSLVQSRYPNEKLQIIAVDDGSNDDTWQWICRAEKAFPRRITPIRLPENKGKRHALYAGFQQSRGEVIITVDSDSVVESNTLWSIASPFVQDPRVGAVAGNVRVLNRSKGLIPRMLEVMFMYSFDFIRAGQSMVNAVLCTPGALSAYRAHVVMRVLPAWIKQTFRGRPANIGEDRAMTNLILREGYHTLFQQDAVVYTNVPVRYKMLCKMFLRWARSNIRETLVMSTFAFRTFREGSMLGARINLLAGWLGLTKSQLLFMGTLANLFMYPTNYTFQVLFGIVVSSSLMAGLYCWRQKSADGLWGYVYGIFWFAALSWITPYAILTSHKTGWLTRGAKIMSQSATGTRPLSIRP